jgi:hypothetical protein
MNKLGKSSKDSSNKCYSSIKKIKKSMSNVLLCNHKCLEESLNI